MTRQVDRPRTDVCGGFKGSTVHDHTGIRLETHAGYQFTPTYRVGDEVRPAHWDPAQWGGSIPRGEVHAAVEQVFESYRVERLYCNPRDWWTEIEEWALAFGDEHVIAWDMGGGSTRIRVVHAMYNRFVTDLGTGTLTHDACPITTVHVANARKLARPNEQYILGKPTDDQFIDMAVVSALAHEAACDARADGWVPQRAKQKMIVRR